MNFRHNAGANSAAITPLLSSLLFFSIHPQLANSHSTCQLLERAFFVLFHNLVFVIRVECSPFRRPRSCDNRKTDYQTTGQRRQVKLWWLSWPEAANVHQIMQMSQLLISTIIRTRNYESHGGCCDAYTSAHPDDAIEPTLFARMLGM